LTSYRVDRQTNTQTDTTDNNKQYRLCCEGGDKNTNAHTL